MIDFFFSRLSIGDLIFGGFLSRFGSYSLFVSLLFLSFSLTELTVSLSLRNFSFGNGLLFYLN